MIKMEDLIKVKGVYVNSRNITSLAPCFKNYEIKNRKLYINGCVNIHVPNSIHTFELKDIYVDFETYSRWKKDYESNHFELHIDNDELIKNVLSTHKDCVEQLILQEFFNKIS